MLCKALLVLATTLTTVGRAQKPPDFIPLHTLQTPSTSAPPSSPVRVAPPTDVRVGSITYHILLVPAIPHKGTDKLYGQITYATHSILIESGHPLEFEQSTVLHELLHAILGSRSGGGTLQDIHEIIAQEETPLVRLLNDNPELVHYLLQQQGH